MPTLRPYQEEDVNFLIQHHSAGIFSEQRTGKTPTALETFKKLGLNKILIICPASAMYQWAEEFELWYQKDCQVAAGTLAKKNLAINNWTNGLVVSYDSFKTTKKSDGLIVDVLKQNPEGIILDEAHRIKNKDAAVTKSIFKTKHIAHKLALTGTPAPNKVHEIWSILHWLKPLYFPAYWTFIKQYFHQNFICARGRQFMEIGGFLPQKDIHLQGQLKQFCVQRKRKDVMPWLPEKDYQKVKLPPSSEQVKYLQELEKWFETEHIIVQGVLDRLIRYRQICLHPKLLGLPGASPKLEWIQDYINDYPDKPIIIFSKFTSFIKILFQELKADSIDVIIGETPIKKRNEIKQNFQAGKLKVLILNIDAGKEALTLDTAEAVIFTDKYPPVSDIQQAEDRFVATTEDKANKPHTIIELIIKGTYDEQLYKMIEQRQTETDVINNFQKYYLERRNAHE